MTMNTHDEVNTARRKTCIAVDSACDLPAQFIAEYNVEILPISVRTKARSFVDLRDPTSTLRFFQQEMMMKGFDADTFPYTAKEMSQRMEEELIEKWDDVLVMTINSARSEIHKNVHEAVSTSRAKFKYLRNRTGNKLPFRMHLLDTGTMFTGQAVLAYEALRLINEEGLGPRQVMARLEAIKSRVHAFLLPGDLTYLKNKASKKGDKSISWLSYQIGRILNVKPIIECYMGETSSCDKAFGFEKGLEKLFNRSAQAISWGLSINVISMSYAGDPAELEKSPSYQNFRALLSQNNIPVMLAVMSTTAAINVGPNSFCIAYSG